MDIEKRDEKKQDEHEGQYYCGICGWVDQALFPNCHATQEEGKKS